MRAALKPTGQKPNYLKTSTARRALLAMVCVAGLAGGFAPASAQEGLDTSSVPRIAGSTDTYVSPAVTHFSTKQTVAETADAAIKTLAAAGWQPYEAPFSSKADIPNQRMMSFKKGSQALSVFISMAPAQGNVTSVQYGVLPVVTDLPFPKDATNTEFDPGRPHLNALTAGSIDQALEFYRAELTARGWALWNAKEGVKQPAGSWPGEKTDKGAYAYYVRDQKAERPLLLTLNQIDGKTRVELKAIPADVLRAQSERKPAGPTAEERAAEAARVAAAKEASDKSRAQHDAMSDAIMKQAQQMIGDVMKDARTPVKPQPPVTVNVNEPALKALAGNAAPVPVPETAEGVDYDAEDGELKFTSASSVQAVAAFHRAAMKPLGWTEGRSVINRPNMVVLDFTKDKKKISMTIMQMGPSANVSARGDGLVGPKTAAAADSKADTPNAVASAPVELEAEDKVGLPIPTQRASSGSSTSPFRREVTADVQADINSVVAFYRRELGKRDWKEEPGAKISATEASLSFTSAEGPGVLKLTRKGSETAVQLTWRRTADAQKAGMLPKAGQSKLLFGNVLDKEATLTINKQTVKIGAGVGAKGPDGPTLDLPPGKYKYSFKAANGQAKTDELEVAAGETWGMLIGPGGVLSLPVY